MISHGIVYCKIPGKKFFIAYNIATGLINSGIGGINLSSEILLQKFARLSLWQYHRNRRLAAVVAGINLCRYHQNRRLAAVAVKINL